MCLIRMENSFLDMLGRAENDVVLVSELRAKSVKEERKTYSDCYYLNFKEEGISFCFKASRLDSIFIYSSYNKDKFLEFKGKLPYGLSWDMNNVNVVQRFGEPSGKPTRSHRIPIYVDYERLGLLIDFVDSSYENLDNRIACICIYQSRQ